MAKNKPAGGYGSRNVTHRKAPKAEPKARAMSPAGTAQLGQHVGSHTLRNPDTGYRGEALERGRGYNAPVGPTNNLVNGPKGQGRTVHRSGSQCKS